MEIQMWWLLTTVLVATGNIIDWRSDPDNLGPAIGALALLFLAASMGVSLLND